MRISKYAKGYSYETSVTGKEEHCMDSQAAVSRTGSKLHRENQALCAPMFGTQLHHRGVSVGIKKFPDRVRFTRALLESKDLSMLFSFSCAFGSPGSAPAPWKQPLRKDLPEPLFPQAGSGVRRKQNKQACSGQVEAANRPVFESLYLEGTG